jgi:hypothetical protein
MNQSLSLSILKSWRNVFLTGQAGAGKTYVINQYIKRLRSCDVAVAITASTGIAATHIGGVTIHSRAGIGIKDTLTDHDMELIQQKEHLHKNITKAKVLILDEISMISATTLDMVDRVVQMIRRDGRPFGGLQVVLVGDFFQLPPVMRDQDNSSNKRFAFASKAWKELDLAICYLHTQHRQDAGDFTVVLNELRKWQASDQSIALLRTRMNQEIAHSNPVKLYTHNIDVDRINDEKLEELTGDEQSYIATWAWDKKLVETIKKSMLAPEVLYLKVWAQVIFVKNNPGKWYFNGTTGEVIDFQPGTLYPKVKISNGITIIAEPESRSVENANEIIVSVKQVPLKLARAITVHKSQGMTLDAAEMDLSKVFEPGQGYVALSRVKALDSLKLLWLNESGLNAHPLVARGDEYFWNQSEILDEDYASRDEANFAELHRRFIELIGGYYVEEVIEKAKVMLSNTVPLRKGGRGDQKKSPKIDTYKITLWYIEKKMSVEDIAKIRELTPGTIRSHILKLHEKNPKLDIAYLKPNKTLFNLVKSAVIKAKQQGEVHPWWFVKSKAVFDILNGTISYDEIKRCMMFL